MNIQSNITIFTGDTQSRSQAERAGADRNTQDSKGKSATFYAGNLLAEFPLQDRLQQRRAQAQERAMKIVSDTWDGDRMIDEQIQESRGRLRELRSTYKDAQDSLRALEAKSNEWTAHYEVDPDSQEQQDLELLKKEQAARGQSRKRPEASDGAWTEESAEDDWDSDWDNMGDMAEGEFDMAREDEFNYDYSQEAEGAYREAYMEEAGLSDGIPLTDGPEEDAAAHMEADGYATEEDFPEEQSESHAGYREAADPLHRVSPASRAWIEVDTRALAHNVDTLRARLPQGCRLMPAVKAQGYGHGAVLISRELNALGVDAFCVAGIGEAIELREADIRGEILILGYTPPEDFPLLAQYQLIQTVIDYPYACLLSQAEADIHVHIGIDTGMHRLGIRCEEIDDIRAVYDLPHIVIDGLFTHLCASDSPLPEHRAFTEAQVRAFYQVVDYLKEAGCPCPSLHLLASYGLLTLLQGRSGLREEQSRRFAERRIASAELKLAADYVRPGIALYGVMSTEADTGPWKGILKPVLSLKAKVVSVRPLYAGEGAGYGIAFTAEEDMRIAAVSIGYADGLPRELSHGKGSVLIGGHRAPIIGRICMDQTIVDVSGIPRIQPGDTAVIIGVDRGEEITAGQIAEQCGTITNEILSRLGARLDRVTV